MSEAFSSSPVPSSSRIASTVSLVAPKLAVVDDEIRRNLRSDLKPIDDAGSYISGGGGKMIRPSLLLLTAGMLGYKGQHDATLGAVFELIHNATLVHDDIIDEAETRRGRPSLNRVHGNTMAILLGDYLYIRSMNVALRAGKLRVIEVLAEATERLIEGEIMAHHLRRRADVTRAQHLSIIEAKTAWLFAACCRIAAVLADAPQRVEDRLADYGMDLGTAFQLVDDLLDLTGDETTVGKPVASDLREGRLTLPWIDLMERGSDDDRREILAVLEDGSFERASYERLHGSLLRHGCLDRTMELAEQYANQARETIAHFPEGAYRDALMDLPELVLRRDR